MKLTRRVEGEVGRDAVEALRIERQVALQPLQRVEAEEAGGAEGQHGERVAAPALFALGIDAGQRVEAALDGREHRRHEGPLAAHDAGDVGAERNRGRHHGGENREISAANP